MDRQPCQDQIQNAVMSLAGLKREALKAYGRKDYPHVILPLLHMEHEFMRIERALRRCPRQDNDGKSETEAK